MRTLLACKVGYPAIAHLLIAAAALAQSPADTFTYQGKITDAISGAPAEGLHDIRLVAYDSASAGTVLGSPVCVNDATVSAGLFTVQVPASLVRGQAVVYLAIEVRADPAGATPCDAGAYTLLSPRQPVSVAPLALQTLGFARNAPIVAGNVRYNAAAQRLEFCDGAFWYPITMGAAFAPGNVSTFSSPGVQNFIVPAGVTQIGIDVWGGGGGGGGRGTGTIASGSCPVTGSLFAGGGGGGGGGSVVRAVMSVTPGESITLIVPGGGGAGGVGATGQAGGAAQVIRGGTVLINVPGGAGGTGGSNVGGGNGGGALSGTGGLGGAAPTVNPTLTVVASTAGASGGFGLGTYCTGAFPAYTFFQANGGGGAGAQALGAPLSSSSTGGGGNGGDPDGNATSGQAGRIRVYWY